MTLAEQVQRSLNDWKPVGAGRQILVQPVADGAWSFAATFDKAEGFGGSVWELALDRTGEAPAALTLKSWADRVANQVSGLLESLKVHEIDDTHGIAVLRSDGPQVRGTARSYYEVTLDGVTKATVRRFHADMTPGSKRAQVAYALTYESIGQVVEGIAG